MLTHFIRKAHRSSAWLRPRVVIGVPSDITQVERRAVRDSALRAKVSEVHLIEESMAAAIGAGMPITEAAGNMVVDRRLHEETSLPVQLAEDPLSSAVLGAGKMLSDLDLLRRITLD